MGNHTSVLPPKSDTVLSRSEKLRQEYEAARELLRQKYLPGWCKEIVTAMSKDHRTVSFPAPEIKVPEGDYSLGEEPAVLAIQVLKQVGIKAECSAWDPDEPYILTAEVPQIIREPQEKEKEKKKKRSGKRVYPPPPRFLPLEIGEE